MFSNRMIEGGKYPEDNEGLVVILFNSLYVQSYLAICKNTITWQTTFSLFLLKYGALFPRIKIEIGIYVTFCMSSLVFKNYFLF